ncbi:MAG: DUF1302 domain-containing protein [Alphaproteobacteria bacterium]|nr:DUF1302 domain-containing protein [Alphaproteobacteria bacterium]
MRNTRETDAAGSLHPVRATGPVAVSAAAALLCGLLQAPPAWAIEFGDGELQGSLSTTFTHGVTVRVEERDPELAADTNGNDGDLNYDRGIVSNTSKFTTDLDVRRGNFGAFVRATGFIDFENERGTRERTPLSDEAKELVGQDFEVLDAYVAGTFDIGDQIVDARLGRHVLNWGESTFIPNGVNAVNHFDVSKLRQPGSELREALLPVGLASFSVSPTDDLAVEAFYQLEWEETRIDPVGSYFSSTDYAGPGAREAVITNITTNDQGFGFGPLTPAINADLIRATLPRQAAFDPDFASVLRGPDRDASDTGQWGLALRYFAADLNYTEFGLYVMNYHSRLPTVGAQTSPRSAVKAGLAAAGAVGAADSTTTQEVTQAVSAEVTQAVQAGLIPPGAAPDIIRNRVTQTVSGVAAGLAIDRYGKSGQYFLEYPEDIQLFGLSFNTVLGASGWALQGEYSFRRDAPLQRAEREVLREGLDPIITGLGLAGAAGAAQARAAALLAAGDLAGAQAAGQAAQQAGAAYQAFLNGYSPRSVQGYVRRDVSQLQATATKVFGPAMGADAVVFVTEAAVMHVHNMPDNAVTPLESPAGGTLAEGEADADATSWGYRLAARLDYNNAVGSINLYPYMQFLHDVSGNSPAPSGPFVEDRTALTLGLRADYLSSWQADLSYTRLAGDGNELSDRDFVSASVKYSF